MSWSYRQNLSDHAGVAQCATDAVCVTASRIDLETCCRLAPNAFFPVITGEEFQILSLDPAIPGLVLNLDVGKVDGRLVDAQSVVFCNRCEQSFPLVSREVPCGFLAAIDRFLDFEIESHSCHFSAFLTNLLSSFLIDLIKVSVVVELLGLDEAVINPLILWKTTRFPDEPFAFRGQRDKLPGAPVRPEEVLFLDQSLRAKACEVVPQTRLITSINESTQIANVYCPERADVPHGRDL